MANIKEPPTKRPPDLLLQMDHWVEALTPAQQSYYDRAEKECAEILSRINDLMKKDGGQVLERGQDVMVIQTSGGSPTVPTLNNLLASATPVPAGSNTNNLAIQLQQPVSNIQSVSGQQLLIQSGAVQSPGRSVRPATSQVSTFTPTPGTFQLVMDPRGFIVGAVPQQPTPANQMVQTTVQTTIQTTAPPQSTTPAPVAPTVTNRVRPAPTLAPPAAAAATPNANARPSAAAVTTRPASSKPSVTTVNSNPGRIILPTSSSTVSSNTTTVTNHRTKPKTTTAVSSAVPIPVSTPTIPASGNRPTENNSIGGLSAGSPGRKALQDRGAGPDSREVTFSKMSGKTFPSLVVIARPHLRIKEMSQMKITQERSMLDGKVKSVLMYTATKFTEWLIQQGLVRSEQFCTVHSTAGGPLKLKLGMYSDVTKFPYSGGYVWISECCPSRFVSVFSGSVFEGAPHPPSVLLKLMYHWCCQTNVQNVVQWVKVDNFYVKNFFTHMRSVCVAAVQELHEKLGGPQKKVEVGVISLGTTSQDGNMRQVKVEVLGVMDPESKLVRLRAVEPLQDGERNYKRRFVKILEPLEQWVHKDSVIVTDFTVDKGTLQSMGFNQVHQSSIPESVSAANNFTNHNIMEYLRRIVPRMFQNTLSLLSRQIIQQFLDELVWRERWGPVPSQAFDSLVTHLAAQTKLDSGGESLLVKLGKISLNPFRKWDYSNWKQNGLVSLAAFASVPIVGNTSQPSTPRVTNTYSACNRVASTVQKPPSRELSVTDKPSEPIKPNVIALRKNFELKTGEDIASQLEQALSKMENGMSLRKAIETFKVPRSLLMEKAQKVLKAKSGDGQNVFSSDEEQDIVDHLFTLHEWGYPFGRWDIRLVVKQYLDCCGRNEPKFKDNFPGDLWIEKFLSRHLNLKEKLCRNIPSRGTFIDTDAVRQYILNLSSVMTGVPSENIVNFMEVGLTGDPVRSMTLELRDLRYPVGKRRVKSAASMMISCTASGQMLPAYIIFEGKCFVINKGPVPGEYYGAKCGWFDECAFEQWLESVLLPWADSLPGKKVIVGDSLAQLFTVKTQALCLDKNIAFVCMPCNLTNLLSPLDAAMFEKLKSNWRSCARHWSSSHGDKFITVDEFPSYIYELLCTTVGPDMSEKLRETFKNVGLFPFNSKAAVQSLEEGGISLNDVKEVTSNQGSQQNEKKYRRRGFSAGLDAMQKKITKSDEFLKGESKTISTCNLDTDKTDELAIKHALENCHDLVCLEEYYYGVKIADPEIVSKEAQVENLNVKCPLCQTFVSSNIDFMNHLLTHSEDSTSDQSLSVHCRYCVKNFKSTEDLEIHLREAHKNFSSPLMCLICVRKFESRPKLIMHMHKCHTELELPFQCSICFYRTSEQYKLVDHFYEVHAGEEKIQCPFCLKCVAISCNGKRMPANTFFFAQHLRKHQSPTSARKCEQCALWFVHRGILKEHRLKDHVSFKNDPSVVPYSSCKLDGIMMPLPGFKPSLVSDGLKRDYTQKPFGDILVNGLTDSSICGECNSPLTSHHIQSFMACLLCSFSTCCSGAMTKHVAVFHHKDRPSSLSDSFCDLTEEMFCACGFRSRSGNSLATHLIQCGEQTAFASSAVAKAATASGQSASFPPLVTLDESELSGADVSEKWMQAFSKRKQIGILKKKKYEKQSKEPPSMLNVLGLVRKQIVDSTSDRCVTPIPSDDENSKERPGSRGSNGGNSSRSRNRKRLAEDAGLDSAEDCTESNSKIKSLASNLHVGASLVKSNLTDDHSKETSKSHAVSSDFNCKVPNLSEVTVTPVSED